MLCISFRRKKFQSDLVSPLIRCHTTIADTHLQKLSLYDLPRLMPNDTISRP